MTSHAASGSGFTVGELVGDERGSTDSPLRCRCERLVLSRESSARLRRRSPGACQPWQLQLLFASAHKVHQPRTDRRVWPRRQTILVRAFEKPAKRKSFLELISSYGWVVSKAGACAHTQPCHIAAWEYATNLVRVHATATRTLTCPDLGRQKK